MEAHPIEAEAGRAMVRRGDPIGDEDDAGPKEDAGDGSEAAPESGGAGCCCMIPYRRRAGCWLIALIELLV